MALLSHRKSSSKSDPSKLHMDSDEDDDKNKFSKIRKGTFHSCAIFLLLLNTAVWIGSSLSTSNSMLQQKVLQLQTHVNNIMPSTDNLNQYLSWSQEITNGIPATVLLRRAAGVGNLKNVISLGPHDIRVLVQKPDCLAPQFSIRWIGPALVFVHLAEVEGGVWSGSFSFLVLGEYRMETKFYGCRGQNQLKQAAILGSYETAETKLSSESIAVSMETRQSSPPVSAQPLFPVSYWKQLSSPNGEYRWSSANETNDAIVKTSDAAVSTNSAATTANGFHMFKYLGNYELLCFLGNSTMKEIHREFLDLRRLLFNYQRPFKFHFYPMAGFFQGPDRYWARSDKERFRKCKHILVNMEELEDSLSQQEYHDQVITFVGHLLKLMNDTTFPIRLFTWMQPPVHATACHSPYLPRTTEHPCNDVLKKLFVPNSTVFPSRVKLLDNTDITLPVLQEGNRQKALANVALRIYVVAGEQVSAWRAVGQQGAVDGLHRNGVVEPNFKLVPYEGWNT